MLARKHFLTGITVLAVGLAGLFVAWSRLASCRFNESEPALSPDGAYSYQIEFTLCDDHARSHSSLVMKKVGTASKVVLLDLTPSIGAVNISWADGPELRVVIAEASIVRRYGPYDEFPRVQITHP